MIGRGTINMMKKIGVRATQSAIKKDGIKNRNYKI